MRSFRFFNHFTHVNVPFITLLPWLLCFTPSNLKASPGDKCYGVQVTEDGGYFILGRNGYAEGGWLIKTDDNGEIIWERVYNFIMTQFQVTEDDGCIMKGVIKVDEEGHIEWSKKTGLFVQWGEQTNEGGFITVGWETSNEMPFYTCYLLKMDTSGQEQWRSIIDRTYSEWYYARPSCVQQTYDGGYVVAFHYSGEWIEKYDCLGIEEWYTPEGPPDASPNAIVRQTPDGGYILGGFIYFSIKKFDSEGNEQWLKKHYDGQWYHIDEFQIKQDSCGIAVGSKEDSLLLMEFDAAGDSLWTRTFHKENTSNSSYGHDYFVETTPDHGFVIAGTVDYIGGWEDSTAIWLIRTDSLGDTLWTRIYESDSADTVTDSLRVIEDSIPDIISDSGMITIGKSITFTIPDDLELTSLFVYDPSGRKVDEIEVSGSSGTVTWGEGFAPGVYFIYISSGEIKETHKVVLIR